MYHQGDERMKTRPGAVHLLLIRHKARCRSWHPLTVVRIDQLSVPRLV